MLVCILYLLFFSLDLTEIMELIFNFLCVFLGYRMPHPLTFDCHIKVQTTDSRTTPVKVFLAALNDLNVETSTLEKNFEV